MTSHAERARELASFPSLKMHTTDPRLLAEGEKLIRRKRDEQRLLFEKALALALVVDELDRRGYPLPIELDEELACFVTALRAYSAREGR